MPLCADESCHTRADLPRIVGRYSHINVKLDKAGGLTEAVALAREASSGGPEADDRMHGVDVALDCTRDAACAISPSSSISTDALLLERDRVACRLTYRGDELLPPTRELWG